MSGNYELNPEASPVPPYTTVLLSQRDLGWQIPINFVTNPAVSLTAACFPFSKYEDDSSADCLSNLLVEGFRRFEIDLFWDESRQLWSFCPVAVPTATASSTASLSFSSSTPSTLTSNVQPSSSSTSSLKSLSTYLSSSLSGPSSMTGSSSLNEVSAREVTSGATATNPGSIVPTTSLGLVFPSTVILSDSPNDPLLQIGPWTCTSTINLSMFTTLLSDYLLGTDNTLGAHIIYVIMNIHAAASDASPSAPASVPSSLPSSGNLLGELFSTNLSSFIYTPVNLRTERTNLNNSWYTVAERFQPIGDYYSTTKDANGIVSTEDGWPTEFYIEFMRSQRLLLQFGNVDPQMAGYNFAADGDTIFPNGYIQDIQTEVSTSSSGQVTSGCLLDGTDYLFQVNSSWAMVANLSDFDYAINTESSLIPTLNLSSNLTNCGISPILNVTLLNATADNNYIPYQNFSYSTIWSWAPGEPRNFSSGSDVGSNALFRCATANADLDGRWTVNDCSQKFFASCQAGNQRYNWTITDYAVSYSSATEACPDSYSFAVPRTALENSYLRQAILDSDQDFDGHGIWIDFNSLNIEGCWTSGGPNATCPYSAIAAEEDGLEKTYVLVPTVAAIIVLIITALTVFVKVAGNRKTTKKTRRRARNGFVYEGVPQ